MTYFDTQQHPMHNSQQWAQFHPALLQGAGYGLGQAAYGQQYGQFGGQPYGGQPYGAQPSIGAFNAGWGQQQPQLWGQQQPQLWGQQQPQLWGQQQRQLSQQDVSEVVRQLLPALPQILSQAQQPQAALGYAAYGQAPRLLSQQDVNEVVRQILPIVPQIVGMLQGQQGGPFGQFGSPQFQSAFGGASTAWGQPQRQLTQQDVADITRQLVGLIPQVIGNLQAFNQQRQI